MKNQDQPRAYNAYQQLADAYADRIDTKPHNAYYDRPAIFSLLPDLVGKRVLDAGCGPGAYAERLVQQGADHVDSFDVSDRMLELAGQRLADLMAQGKVTLHRVDMTQPLDPFKDAHFDIVNAPLCLDYVEDWRALFSEFKRVLAPGGFLVFSCGHPSFDAEYFQTDDYFSVEAVSSEWSGFGKIVEVPCYRRPFQEMINPLIEAGLVVDRVLEPTPTTEFQAADPIRYRTLMHRPGFLCVRARKQG